MNNDTIALQDAIDALDRYREHGTDPGDFLMAVLENNLSKTFSCASESSRRNLCDIVSHVYNHMPTQAWKDKERISAWMAHRGLQGLNAV